VGNIPPRLLEPTEAGTIMGTWNSTCWFQSQRSASQRVIVLIFLIAKRRVLLAREIGVKRCTNAGRNSS